MIRMAPQINGELGGGETCLIINSVGEMGSFYREKTEFLPNTTKGNPRSVQDSK